MTQYKIIESIVYGTVVPKGDIRENLNLFEQTLRTQLDTKIEALDAAGYQQGVSELEYERSEHMGARLALLLMWGLLIYSVVARLYKWGPGWLRSKHLVLLWLMFTCFASIRYARLTKRASMFAADPQEILALNARLAS